MMAGAGAGIETEAMERAPALVRLHAKLGGKRITHAGEIFAGVSPDMFVNLDNRNPAYVYRITRKLNLTIGINPEAWSTTDFFRHFTRGQRPDGKFADSFDTGALHQKEKCHIHGDKESKLFPSFALKGLLGVGNLAE